MTPRRLPTLSSPGCLGQRPRFLRDRCGCQHHGQAPAGNKSSRLDDGSPDPSSSHLSYKLVQSALTLSSWTNLPTKTPNCVHNLAPPQPDSCTVSEVFHDNCVVNWRPPADNGGTDITHYIVEEQNGRWQEVEV